MEMEGNERGFKPFNIKANLTDSINGYPADAKLWKTKLSFIKYNDYLNEAAVGKTFSSAPIKFLKIINEAGEKVINEYYKSLN